METGLLLDYLAQHFDDLTPLVPLRPGEDSAVFAIDADGNPLVVRVNETGNGFEKDDFAHDLAHAVCLPVPEVLLIDRFEGRWVCVSRRVRGDTLQSLPKGVAFGYGAAVSRTLDAIASTSIGVAGAGPLSRSGASWGSWPGYVSGIADRPWPLAEAQTFADLVAKMAAELPDRRQLVHGDFGSNNVLVAGGAVTGVVDWSEAMLGDGLYDTANILFWRPWLDCMEEQCRYFETQEPWRLAASDRLTCYQLHIGLNVLWDALHDDDRELVAWTLARLQAIAAA